VYAYGYSNRGGLGLGLTDSVTVPTVVAGLPSGIRAISAAGDTSMALDASGNVWAWGVGAASSLLANGSFSDQNTPRRLDGLTGVGAIAAERDGAMLLLAGNAVYLAGANIASLPGATCPGTLNGCLLITPTAQSQLGTGVAGIAGGSALYAMTAGGLEYAWGARNVFGELGTGAAPASGNYAVPALVQGLTGARGLGSGGLDQAVAWRSDGTVFIWGYTAAHFTDPSASAYASLTQPTAIPGFVLH
jgi:alpha-tubulin suppressor-like RCC1 family protein